MSRKAAMIGLGAACLAAIILAPAILASPAGPSGPTTAPAPPAPPAPRCTVILGAVAEEIRLLRISVEAPHREEVCGIEFTAGRLHGREVAIVLGGVGKVNAAMTATAAIVRFRPAEVLFTGVAGGINPELRPGDIVLGAKVAQHDYGEIGSAGLKVAPTRNPLTGKRNPVFFPGDETLLRLAAEAGKGIELEPIRTGNEEHRPRVEPGTIVTGDVFVASEDKCRQLRQDLQADATEMEGAAVAQVCHQLGVPCLVIRSLSDRADSQAVVDLRKFHATAARNSAKLVEALVARLAAAPATRPAATEAARP